MIDVLPLEAVVGGFYVPPSLGPTVWPSPHCPCVLSTRTSTAKQAPWVSGTARRGPGPGVGLEGRELELSTQTLAVAFVVQVFLIFILWIRQSSSWVVISWHWLRLLSFQPGLSLRCLSTWASSWARRLEACAGTLTCCSHARVRLLTLRVSRTPIAWRKQKEEEEDKGEGKGGGE